MPDWNHAQQMGLIASWTTTYAGSEADCAEIAKNYSTGNLPNFPFVSSFVFQFKDAKSAADFYSSGSFMGLDPVGMGSQGIAGSKTGFGPNSAVINSSPVYFAYWQNKQYIVLVSAFFMSNSAASLAKKVNSRIP